jgi:mono/diheme cytochrome c family protein
LSSCGSAPGPSAQDAGPSVDAGPQPDAGPDTDTWTNWASADFFSVYCTSCHQPGQEGDPSGANLDFRTYPDVQSNADLIRCGVSVAQDPSWHCAASPPAKQFPIGPGPFPSDADRDRAVAWISAGFAE